MTTTYILHGGAALVESKSNAEYYSLFTSTTDKKSVTILMCLWARDKSRWDELLKEHQKRILAQTGKEVELIIAETPQDLLQKLDNCDVLYIDGGSSENYQTTYELPSLELKQKLNYKVCIGSSMGAFLISTYSAFSLDRITTPTIQKGLKLLPLNCLVHWDIEEKKKEKITLIQSVSSLPILTLNEGEHARFIA